MNIDDKKIEEICVNVLGDIVKVKAEKKVREERYYGIQAFDNVEDAWYVMAGEFSGQCEGLGDVVSLFLMMRRLKQLSLNVL